MRRFFNSQDRNIAINMTPMVDVTFLLLTFCMLTTRFASTEKVNVDLPRPNDNQAHEQRFKDKIIINLQYMSDSAKAEIQLGPVKIASVDDLSGRLGELARESPGAQVILRADRRLPYRDVRGVMEAVAGAKLTSLQVVTDMEPKR
jgi:biopolymer transport protein ExbD